MKKFAIPGFRSFLFSTFLVLSATAHAANPADPDSFDDIDYAYKLLLLGASAEGGNLKVIGDTVCDQVNTRILQSKLRCGSLETAGSEFNVMAVVNEFVQLGLTQSDTVRALSRSHEVVQDKLRLVASFTEGQMVGIYVKPDIATLQGLRGRVFNMGLKGSGSYKNAQTLFSILNMRLTDFKDVQYVAPGGIADAFCSGKIDAGLLTTMHPNPIFEKITACGGKILSLPADIRAKLKEAIPGSHDFTLSKSSYSGLAADVETVSVWALLVSSKDVDPESIYRLMRLINNHYGRIADKVPFVSRRMATLEELKAVNIPIHDGTLRAYAYFGKNLGATSTPVKVAAPVEQAIAVPATLPAVVPPAPAPVALPVVVPPTPAALPVVVSPAPVTAVAVPAPAPEVVAAPVAPTPVATPVLEAPAPAPVVAPVVEAPAPAPVVAPVVEAPAPAPVVAPVVEAPAPAPVVAPVVEAPAPAPVVAPVVEAPAPAPVAAPVVEAPAPAPVVAPQSKADTVKPRVAMKAATETGGVSAVKVGYQPEMVRANPSVAVEPQDTSVAKLNYLQADIKDVLKSLKVEKDIRSSNEVNQLVVEALASLSNMKLNDASLKMNKALKLDAANSNIHFLNGLVYHLQAKSGDSRKTELALEGYRQAINFDQSNVNAHYFMGLAHYEMRAFRDAETAFAEALLLRPDDVEIGLHLASAAYVAGDASTSCAVVHKMVGKSQVATDALKKRTLKLSVPIYASCQKFDLAQQSLAALQKLDRNDSDYQMLKTRVEDWRSFYATNGFQRTADGDVVPVAPPVAAAAGTEAVAPMPVVGMPAPAAAAAVPEVPGAAAAVPGAATPAAPAVDPAAAAAAAAAAMPGAAPGGMPGAAPMMAGAPGMMPGAPGGDGADPNCGKMNGLPPDKQTRMVLVDVVLLRTEDNISTQKGVNMLNGLSLMFGSSSNPAYQLATTVNNAGTATASAATTITRGITVPAMTYTLNIANANSANTEVLAKPSLTVMECRKSEFFSGTNMTAALVMTGTAGTSGSAVTIDKKYGVTLGVTAEILKDNQIRLLVDASRTFLQPPSGNINFQYKLEISEMTSKANVVLRLGDTLVLGGLSETETDTRRDGVPILQDIPGLQYLFSQESETKYNRSVLMLITPRPASYTWLSDASKAAINSKDPFSPAVDSLRARYGDWFKPFPNLGSVFHHMNLTSLYREFRTADVTLEKWDRMLTTGSRLRQATDFLYY